MTKKTSILMKETGCRSTTLLEITFNSLIQALNSIINGKVHTEKKILAIYSPLFCFNRTWLSLDPIFRLLKLCNNLSCNLLKMLSNLICAHAYSNIVWCFCINAKCHCLHSFSWLIVMRHLNVLNWAQALMGFENYGKEKCKISVYSPTQLLYGFRKLKI